MARWVTRRLKICGWASADWLLPLVTCIWDMSCFYFARDRNLSFGPAYWSAAPSFVLPLQQGCIVIMLTAVGSSLYNTIIGSILGRSTLKWKTPDLLRHELFLPLKLVGSNVKFHQIEDINSNKRKQRECFFWGLLFGWSQPPNPNSWCHHPTAMSAQLRVISAV